MGVGEGAKNTKGFPSRSKCCLKVTAERPAGDGARRPAHAHTPSPFPHCPVPGRRDSQGPATEAGAFQVFWTVIHSEKHISHHKTCRDLSQAQVS